MQCRHLAWGRSYSMSAMWFFSVVLPLPSALPSLPCAEISNFSSNPSLAALSACSPRLQYSSIFWTWFPSLQLRWSQFSFTGSTWLYRVCFETLPQQNGLDFRTWLLVSRSSSLPIQILIRLSAVSIQNIWWLATHRLWVPILKRLPESWTEEWLP